MVMHEAGTGQGCEKIQNQSQTGVLYHAMALKNNRAVIVKFIKKNQSLTSRFHTIPAKSVQSGLQAQARLALPDSVV